MSNSKWQRLLGAALVALLLTTSLTPVAMAATPAAVAQQVTEATELTALLPGGEFYKVWLALTPDGPNVNVTVTAEWDRDNALETGVGFYVLDENNLAAVVNGEPLPANNVGIGSSNFFLNGSSNMQGTSFSATGTSYTVVLFNDSNSDANVTLRVTNATISDDSGQVSAPGATDDATADATATMTDTATTTDTTTVATTDTVTDTATDTTDTAADATDTVTDTAATTETVAATPAATEAAATTAAAVPAGPVRAETMEGELPEQYNQHFLALEPSVRDGDITLVLTYDPQDSTELARRINFWVLDDAGFRRYQDGESASAVAIAAGSQSFIEPDTSNKREASFQATGFGPYTVIVQNNSRVPATYQLAVTGGVLVDDSAQTLTAQQAGGVTATGTTTGTVATTATTTTTAAADATTATTTTATTTAGTGVAGTPGGTYTVQSGDTLAIIARDIYGDYRLYEQLCAFNNIADCNVIEVGQVINLPTEAEIGAVAAPAAAATTAATPAADAADAATPAATVAATPAATTTVTATTPVTGTGAVTTTATTTGTTGVGATGTTTGTTGTTGATTTASGTIVDVASESGEFTILLDALQQAELDAALSGSGPFTVFAPTDAAFEELLSGNNLTEDQLLQAQELADILQYHVLSGRLLAADMTDGSRATTLQGQPVTFEVRDGSVFINGAELVTTDIEASNGVIHAINAVILPPQ